MTPALSAASAVAAPALHLRDGCAWREQVRLCGFIACIDYTIT